MAGIMIENITSQIIDEDCVIRDEISDSDIYHFLIYGVAVNVVGIFGLIGNIISISILSRHNMRSSINCCLVGLATFDTILITTSLLMFGLPAIPEYTGSMMWYHKVVFPWVTLAAYPLGIVAQTGSVYLTVTVTLERYVAVCHPLKARYICTYGRAKIYVTIVALFSLLYNVPRFWEVTYKNCVIEGHGNFTTVVMTEMRKSQSYIQIYITWMYLLVMYLLPFISLLVFNIYIYRQVRRARMYNVSIRRDVRETGGQVRLANHERQRLSRLQKKELGLAVMLLVVVIVFFVCNILAFIVSVLEILEISITYLTMTNNLLVTINSSVNFVIYCIFGQKFRRLFFQMFCFGIMKAGYEAGESIMGVNSVYGEGRPINNGRSVVTQSIRLTSCNGSSISANRISGRRALGGSWQGGRVSGGGLGPVSATTPFLVKPLNESNTSCAEKERRLFNNNSNTNSLDDPSPLLQESRSFSCTALDADLKEKDKLNSL